MCNQIEKSKNNSDLNQSDGVYFYQILNKPIFGYSLAIIFGLMSGFSNIGVLQTIGLALSEIFIKMFQCISLPIIALSIIVTVSQQDPQNSMKNVWQRTLFYTLSTTVLAACVACGLYILLQPENIYSVGTVASEHANINIATGTNYTQYLINIIPKNIFAPFLEHQVMGVLLVGLLVGFAIRFIPDQTSKKTITSVFKGLHSLLLVITGWIVKIIPIGLYGFITATIVQFKTGGLGFSGLGTYLSVIVLANLIQGFVVLPVWLKSRGIKPFQAMRAMVPALSLAFFSKSSAGTLPVTMSTAEKNLNINPKISRFVLPLCTTINMNGCAAFIFTTVIYLMQNQGLEITGLTLVSWIGISTLAAVGNAGVPMGCFFLSASLLSSMNIPITLLGVILPFYSLIDMVETSLNVWSDICVTKIVDLDLAADQEWELNNSQSACPVND